VDAVVAVQGQNPAGAFRAVKILTERIKDKDWEKTLDTFARCVRITRDLEKTYPVNGKLFKEKAEKALFSAVQKTDKNKLSSGDLDGFFNLFDPLIPLITDFFDNVLVMDEDLALKENRLGLLQTIAGFADDILDLGRLEGF